MGVDGRDPDLSGHHGVLRLLPELVDSLPAISRAPFTGQGPGWRATELNPLTSSPDELRERGRSTVDS